MTLGHTQTRGSDYATNSNVGSCPAFSSQYFENCLMPVIVVLFSFFTLFNICRISAVLTTTHQDRAKNQGRNLDCVENFFDKAATFQWFEVGLCFDASLGTDCVIHYRFKLLSHAKSRCQQPSFSAVSSSKTAAATASAESYAASTPPVPSSSTTVSESAPPPNTCRMCPVPRPRDAVRALNVFVTTRLSSHQMSSSVFTFIGTRLPRTETTF